MFWKKKTVYETRPVYSIRQELERLRPFVCPRQSEGAGTYTEADIQAAEEAAHTCPGAVSGDGRHHVPPGRAGCPGVFSPAGSAPLGWPVSSSVRRHLHELRLWDRPEGPLCGCIPMEAGRADPGRPTAARHRQAFPVRGCAQKRKPLGIHQAGLLGQICISKGSGHCL